MRLQGHPEFNRDIVRDLVDTRQARGIIEISKAHHARLSLEMDLDAFLWQDMLVHFLKTRL